MKPLLPTLEERKRYLAYEVISASPVRRDVSGELRSRIATFLGTFGMAEAGLLSVLYDNNTQTGLLRVSVKQASRVRAAMLTTTFLGKTRVCIRTLGVSGIMKKAKAYLPAGTA